LQSRCALSRAAAVAVPIHLAELQGLCCECRALLLAPGSQLVKRILVVAMSVCLSTVVVAIGTQQLYQLRAVCTIAVVVCGGTVAADAENQRQVFVANAVQNSPRFVGQAVIAAAQASCRTISGRLHGPVLCEGTNQLIAKE
jgi:hypothetical protein